MIASPSGSALEPLVNLLRGKRTLVLTGAGCSTESGIPDYRGPETRRRARNPIQHAAFISDPLARQRYWARSTLGWPRFVAARPNPAHVALAALERQGSVCALLTQNVDRLHTLAGSQQILELHGALAEVICLACEARTSRDALQTRILAANPHFAPDGLAELAPDGDAELPLEAVRAFEVPACESCGGALKPEVVFFGDSVPREKVERAFTWLDDADALLVVGSSLAVFSGYRFVLRALDKKIPIAMVNLGESRGDAHAMVRLDATAGEILPALHRALAR